MSDQRPVEQLQEQQQDPQPQTAPTINNKRRMIVGVGMVMTVLAALMGILFLTNINNDSDPTVNNNQLNIPNLKTSDPHHVPAGGDIPNRLQTFYHQARDTVSAWSAVRKAVTAALSITLLLAIIGTIVMVAHFATTEKPQDPVDLVEDPKTPKHDKVVEPEGGDVMGVMAVVGVVVGVMVLVIGGALLVNQMKRSTGDTGDTGGAGGTGGPPVYPTAPLDPPSVPDSAKPTDAASPPGTPGAPEPSKPPKADPDPNAKEPIVDAIGTPGGPPVDPPKATVGLSDASPPKPAAPEADAPEVKANPPVYGTAGKKTIPSNPPIGGGDGAPKGGPPPVVVEKESAGHGEGGKPADKKESPSGDGPEKRTTGGGTTVEGDKKSPLKTKVDDDDRISVIQLIQLKDLALKFVNAMEDTGTVGDSNRAIDVKSNSKLDSKKRYVLFSDKASLLDVCKNINFAFRPSDGQALIFVPLLNGARITDFKEEKDGKYALRAVRIDEFLTSTPNEEAGKWLQAILNTESKFPQFMTRKAASFTESNLYSHLDKSLEIR